uniref:Eukaryotic translation initiation factor 4G n=1 Tax=Zea mays TaxID=4577 RepID=A0A804R080_MAIZE
MKTRIVYSREFLLSLGELEHCKKLPPDFDAALLSELQELSAGVLERNKGYYNTSQGRPDGSVGYTYSSRGGNTGGRWDTRSSGSSDRDGEPDRESQTQGRGANQYRRNWQNTEHDGLLGRGGFPRPSGYTGQLSSKDHGNAPQLNRTSERYQPPRPYKAAPFSRKDIDSINDETFGSSELSNEDRAEEERKRRASFELMRKEQHKAVLGKKSGPDILKENPSDDIFSKLQTSTAKANAKTKNEKLDGSVVSSYQEDTTKPSSVLLAPAARPLVPPGFANAFADKKLQSQSSNITHEPKLEDDQSATGFTSESKEKGVSGNDATMGPKHTLPPGSVTSSAELASSVLKGSEDWDADVMDKYSIGKEGKSKNIDPVRKDDSVAILEQFFGNVLSKSGSNLPTYVENQPLKTDDDMITSVPESSKFAHWFLDEDLKPAEDLSSKSLLSMIVKNENPEAVPIMTCEDLEQTMLAQVSNSSSTQINATKEQLTVMDEPVAMQKVTVDNHASQHLLSLLQKGTDNKGAPSLGFQRESTDEPLSVDTNLMANGGISGSDPVNSVENVPTSGKDLTLEALFGAAFMNELHSKDAPVSIRGATTGGPTEFAEMGKTLLSSSHEGYYPVEQTVHFNNTKDAAVRREPGIEHSAVPGLSQGSASFDKKGMEIHLPEEDNLFTMSDSLLGQNSDILASVGSSRVEGLLPEKALDNLSYRFQSLVPGDAEHIQVYGPDALGSHPRDSQNMYHLLQGRPPMIAPHPMMDHIVNRKQPAPFDMAQSIHHDSHRSFPSNVNHMQHNLHGPGVPHLDPAGHIMRQHMSMPGRFPPEGLPRGVPPSQPVHHMAGYRPEMGNVNNFHMHPRQPNYGEFGLMMPGPSGPEVRGNHPEAFERLIQMEMSARSKQQQVHHPAMAAGRVPSGMYGHELDAKLRYR